VQRRSGLSKVGQGGQRLVGQGQQGRAVLGQRHALRCAGKQQ